jgi:hypothetical protein
MRMRSSKNIAVLETEYFFQYLAKPGLYTRLHVFHISNVNQEVLENFGHFGGKYLQDKLLPTLKEKIFLTSQSNHIIPRDWKNNNCESMNHKIKMLGDWKVSKIPDLIDRIRHPRVSIY